LWLFARTKSTNVALLIFLSKTLRSSIGLSNKKKFVENKFAKTKLQWIWLVVVLILEGNVSEI
jgi:hypothetical protein